MKCKNRFLDETGLIRGKNSKKIIRKLIEPKTKTKMESQVWLLTTRYTTLMNASETIARDAANIGNEKWMEAVSNFMSPNCDQIRATTAISEV